jgi:hypothetical protein
MTCKISTVNVINITSLKYTEDDVKQCLMNIYCTYNGKVKLIKKAEEKEIIVKGPSLSLPIRLVFEDLEDKAELNVECDVTDDSTYQDTINDVRRRSFSLRESTEEKP